MKILIRSIKHAIKFIFSNLIPQRILFRLGRYMLDLSLGDGDDNPHSNGEYRLLDYIKSHIDEAKSGAHVFFDVGANLGEWSLRAAKNNTRNLLIYSFEPCESIYQRLCSSILLNDFSKSIFAFNTAIGEKVGVATLHVYNEFSGSNSIYRRKMVGASFSHSSIEKISINTGDAFCLEHQVSMIHFLKIDTEGHEISVLRGFSDMIGKQKISVIQFEYGGTWLDSHSYLHEAFELLQPSNYIIGKLLKNRIEVFEKYDSRLETFRYSNYVAISKDASRIFETDDFLSRSSFPGLIY